MSDGATEMTPFEAKGWTKSDGHEMYMSLFGMTKIEDDKMSDGATEMMRDEQIKMNPGDWVDATKIDTKSHLFAIRLAVRGMGYRVSAEWGNWEDIPEADVALMLDRDGDLMWVELDKVDGCEFDYLKLLELGGYFRGQYARDHSVPLEQADEAEWIDARMEQVADYDSGDNEGVKPDMVNHPPHYRQGGIECIEAIKAALTDEEFRGYCKGNSIKYVWREKHKGGGQDIKKAAWYLGGLK